MPKEKLFRLVASNGLPELDLSGKAKGRGCYLLKSKDAVDKLSLKHLRRHYPKMQEEDLIVLKEKLYAALG